MTHPLTTDEKEQAHKLAIPHVEFCHCLAAIRQRPTEVRRAALEELLLAVHGALAELDDETQD